MENLYIEKSLSRNLLYLRTDVSDKMEEKDEGTFIRIAMQ